MDAKGSKPVTERVSTLAGIIKNTKFIITTVLVLIILGLALVSGDGLKIALNFYEDVTGQKYEIFSPIQDHASESYLVLKAKLSQGRTIENAVITVFEESNTSFKYRVVINGDVNFYRVRKKHDGVWHILKM